MKKNGLGNTWEVYPGEDYRDVIGKLQPGDELVFHEGVYEGHAVIEAYGLPDKPITIRGYGNGEARPVILWEGTGVNMWSILGCHLIFDYLELNSTHVYAMRIGNSQTGGKDITIHNCIFRDCGWSFCTNYADVVYEDIRVLNSQFIYPKATPVYIGHHSGVTKVSGFVFEGNFIEGSKIVNPDIVGYGIELKLNVKGGIVRNNLIMNTKGPCIMVYGSQDGIPSDANIVEGNIVMGSRESSGIVVGDGPSVVRNNIAMGCLNGGIMVYDYNNRGLLYDVQVYSNTATYNEPYDMSFIDINEATKNIKVTDNMVFSKENIPSYRNLSELTSFVETSNNQANPVTPRLAQLVEGFKKFIPDMDRLAKIWPKLENSPFDEESLVEILEELEECRLRD